MKEKKELSPERIMQFAWGYAPALVLAAAVRHRVFDLLDGQGKDAATLARETGASERGLRILLNALVGLEFLNRANDKYSLTPESEKYLVSNKTTYFGPFFEHVHKQLLPNWMQLPEVVRSGKPATPLNEQETGAEFFAEFVEALFPLNYPAAKHLAEHLDVASRNGAIRVLDLAAGSGLWSIVLAKSSPNVHIHAVDWPKVLGVTQRVAERHGVADRLNTIGGDLLEADFGSGYHIATLGHILHSEGEERARRLLTKTFAALAPGGIIAIAEFIPNDDRTGPTDALLFAVNMLVHTERGDTFTFAEISDWLRDAGFTNPRLLDAPAVSPLILAERH